MNDADESASGGATGPEGPGDDATPRPDDQSDGGFGGDTAERPVVRPPADAAAEPAAEPEAELEAETDADPEPTVAVPLVKRDPEPAPEPEPERLSLYEAADATGPSDPSDPSDPDATEEPVKQRRTGRVVALSVAAVVLLAGGLYGAAYAVAGDKVARGTTVAGIDIGGLSRADAE
ncbi:MAG TPA: hypothetical protein VGE77_13080, partial [Nocardioides sp.]